MFSVAREAVSVEVEMGQCFEVVYVVGIWPVKLFWKSLRHLRLVQLYSHVGNSTAMGSLG